MVNSLEDPFLLPGIPLHFIGDSNTILFRDCVVRMDAISPRPFVLQACSIPGLSIEAAYDGERFHPFITEYLRVHHFPRSVFSLKDREEYLNYFLARHRQEGAIDDSVSSSGEKIAVFMCGTMDLADVLREIGPAFDFPFDDPRFDESAFPDRPRIASGPLSIVDALISKRFATLAGAFRALLDGGVDRLYVHSLHPPTLDDERYFEHRRQPSLARVRYKVALLMNRYLQAAALEAEAVFLDMWQATTKNGVLDERFILDGDHLNAHAAALTVRHICEDLARERGAPTAWPPIRADGGISF